jgi:cobalt/nickel transport system permease protein
VNPALLEPYEPGHSPLHRLPAGLKCAAALGAVVGIVLLPRGAWAAYAASAAALLGLALLSRVRLARLGMRLVLVEPFALGVALLSLAQPGGPRIFAAVLTRGTLCLSAMLLLAVTTRFTDILRVLWRIRVPALLVTVLALMYRYLFLLLEESARLSRARRSRTLTPGRAVAWRSSADVIAALFVRSSERAERVYAAMCARGWKT